MKKRLLSLLLAVLMLCSLAPGASALLTPVLSGNVQYQSYHDASGLFSRWAMPVWSYLHPCAEGMERVEYIPHGSGMQLIAEQYTMDGEIVGRKEIPIELPIFGGFFAGSDANFVVFGQKNADNSDAAEIIRVVRYSKAWQRLDSVSLYGENTAIPFDAGSLRMTEDGAYLYVHTCHEMYSGHQANLTFLVRKSDMTVTDVRSDVMNDEYGYVSHSFNQFLALDGDRLITLDHGDASPRAAYLYRHKPVGSSGKCLPNFSSAGYALRGEGVRLMTFRDIEDDNATGANLGGLAVTSTHYLVAGSSVDQTAAGVDPDNGQRNVFVAAVPKDSFTDAAVQVRWLTDYADLTVFTPQLVQVSRDRCLLLWCTGEGMRYVFLKADGSADGPVYSADASLSDCAPTVIDGKVWWYSTEHWSYPEHNYLVYFGENWYEEDGAAPTFYCIDPANPGTVQEISAKDEPHEHQIVLRDAAEPTCTKPGYTGDQVCAVCGKVLEVGSVIPAPGHKTELRGEKAASCETAGYTGDTVCTVCGEVVEAGKSIPALGHAWDSGRITKQPTESEEGVKTFTCGRCGKTRTESIPMLSHTHVMTKVEKVNAACTKSGTEAYWKCTGCGKLFSDAAGMHEIAVPVVIPAPGHKTELRGEKAASCETAGYSGDWVCTVCGEIVEKGKTIPAPGHSWGVWQVTKPAAEDAEGEETRACERCGKTETRATGRLTPVNPFTDVKPGAFYYDAVLWAVNRNPQITNGTSATAFSPEETCTRGQVVTFLWRAMGCPEPTSTVNDFADVKPGNYFYKAVLWAAENGITNGVNATHFNPNGNCTRAHVVTFLWRAHEKPAAAGSNPFRDVAAGQYYTDAVLWAVSKGITNGVDAKRFGPDQPCTRAQIVTFLYRDLT